MSESVKLDFGKFQSAFKNDDELNAELSKGKGGGSKFFPPGLYELEIVSAKVKTNDKGEVLYCKDPSWVWFEYELKGVDSERKIRHSLMVPLRNEHYKAPGAEKSTTFVYRTFKEFCNALGLAVNRDALVATLTTYFHDPAVQVGARLKATIGYQAAHSVMVRKKSDEGGLLLKLVDASGKDILNDKGESVTGVNDEQLKLFCKTRTPEIKFNGFTNITKVEPSDNPKPIKIEKAASSSIFDE